MKLYLPILLASSLFVVNLKAQNLREEVTLKGTNYKIFDATSNDKDVEKTIYQVVGNQNEKIEHTARI